MTKDKTGFALTVTGDRRKILDAVRNYGWDATDKATRDAYYHNLLDSMSPENPEDPDSDMSFRVELDCLRHIAGLIDLWFPVAREISVWAYGRNDEAAFEVGIVYQDRKHELVMPFCRSHLKSQQGKIAEAALEAHRLIGEAMKEKP